MDEPRKSVRMGIVLVILGVICVLYGIVIMRVGSGTWFFTFWYVLGAVILATAWVVLSGRWDGFPSIVRYVVEGVVALLLVGFIATLALIAQDFSDEGEPGLDYIIVLGAQVHERGPSRVLQNRLDAAYEYLRENEGTKCIVSGGQGPNEHTAEANVMADYLVERGIEPSRIIVEDRSENTVQNIRFSMALIDPERDHVGIVTNNFHVFRALRIARKAGMAHVCGIAAGSLPLYLPNNVARESLGIAKDFALGNV